MSVKQIIEAAMNTLEAYELDYGERLDDQHELGRIDESRNSPSFRIRVGHIRTLAAEIDERPLLDRAWAHINALGGRTDSPEDEAYGRALDDCMAILERLGATDKIWKAEF